jgi:hypothetical protein
VPVEPQATPPRVRRSTLLVSANECASCRRSSSGTRHPLSTMSAFCTVRSAILFSIFVVVMPGLSWCTTKPLTLSSATSRAQTTTRSAKVPLPIQRFSPSITHSSPSRRAVVSSPRATSDPPCGSVSPNAPIFSIRAIAGSQRSRCSAEPQRSMLPIARPLWMPKKLFIDGSVCAISIDTNPTSWRRAAGPSRPS